jgi:transposase
VKDATGCVYREGKIGSTRHELDAWIRTLPQPRTIGMDLEALKQSLEK